MPGHKTWAIGEEVIASDFTIVSDQIAAQFASPAARTAGWASPPNGAVSVLTNLDAQHGVEVWNGTAWRKPWNEPWGFIGETVVTANSGTVPGGGAVTSWFGVTVNVVQNRRYKITASVYSVGAAGTGDFALTIWDGTTAQLAGMALAMGGSASNYAGKEFSVTWVAPASGSKAFNLRLYCAATAMTGTAGPTVPAFIRVEDVGPAGVPA